MCGICICSTRECFGTRSRGGEVGVVEDGGGEDEGRLPAARRLPAEGLLRGGRGLRRGRRLRAHQADLQLRMRRGGRRTGTARRNGRGLRHWQW